ncbi:hypothetical protein ONZ45_g17154 [Pleurotus djamor]|nr:hypothetical protein ONZ45_g17154 [Pleurotus djamor]
MYGLRQICVWSAAHAAGHVYADNCRWEIGAASPSPGGGSVSPGSPSQGNPSSGGSPSPGNSSGGSPAPGNPASPGGSPNPGNDGSQSDSAQPGRAPSSGTPVSKAPAQVGSPAPTHSR